MGFIKGALFGIAVYAAVQHITKKDILTGRSLLDDWMDKAPEYVDKVKVYASQVSEEFIEPEMRI
ncbi:MAG: YtxH domain-containing protein [Pedobacter sp.]|jgi:hypothetical protein|uniref:YtxH domain-containing protein n=1 Tax=Pedobacter sp. TaxID=1411316 RepID=UPI003562900C